MTAMNVGVFLILFSSIAFGVGADFSSYPCRRLIEVLEKAFHSELSSDSPSFFMASGAGSELSRRLARLEWLRIIERAQVAQTNRLFYILRDLSAPYDGGKVKDVVYEKLAKKTFQSGPLLEYLRGWPPGTRFTGLFIRRLSEIMFTRSFLTGYRVNFFNLLVQRVSVNKPLKDAIREEIDSCNRDAIEETARRLGSEWYDMVSIGLGTVPIREMNSEFSEDPEVETARILMSQATEIGELYAIDSRLPVPVREAVRENLRFFQDMHLEPNGAFLSLIRLVQSALALSRSP